MAGTSNEPTTDTSGPPTTVFTYPGGRSRCSTALAIERLARLVATLSLHHFVPLNDAFAQAKNHLGSYSLAAHDFTQHARARRLTLAVRVIWPDRTEQAFILRSTFWRWHEIYNGLRSGADPPQRDWATVRQVRGNPASMLGQWYVFVGRRRFERLYSVSTPSKSTPKARSGGPSGASRKIPEQPPNTAKEFVPYAVGRWPRRKDEGAGEYVGRSPIAARAPKMVAAYNSEPVVGAESGLV